MTNIAVFASGQGSNAQEIIRYFKDHSSIAVSLIVCNKPGAGVIEIGNKNQVEVLLVNRQSFYERDFLQEFKKRAISFIVLAGFLWKIPDFLIDEFPGKIINIHPALLPNYGGKGMYGNAVHAAVIANKEKKSGITIHFVDEHYDNGDIIFQEYCKVDEGDTPESLANKIHLLEHAHYPVQIEKWIHAQNER